MREIERMAPGRRINQKEKKTKTAARQMPGGGFFLD
jgi:hypothetical protein